MFNFRSQGRKVQENTFKLMEEIEHELFLTES